MHQLGSREHMPLPVVQHSGLRVQFPFLSLDWFRVLVLNCTVRMHHGGFHAYIGIPIRDWTSQYWARLESLILVPAEETENFKRESIIVREPAPFSMDPRPTSFSFVRIHHQSDIPQDSFVIDEVYCLPHATYSPTERRIEFPVGHTGPHGVIFFTPRPHTEPRLSQHLRYSRPISFAIVLGQSSEPEYAFVPLLASESPHEDFHLIFHMDKRLVSHCMTKAQLKRGLKGNCGWDFLWRPSTSIYGQILDCRMLWKPLESRLHVTIRTGQLNLMENTLYIFLQVSVCKSSDTVRTVKYRKRFVNEEESLREFNDNIQERLRKWWKIKELGWFEERC